jgi:hypothetical protein
MSCCGRRRRAHKAWLMSRPVRLRFLGEFAGEGAIEVKGSVTGKPYVFSEETREMAVDPRDAGGFLQQRSFALAGNSALQATERQTRNRDGS